MNVRLKGRIEESDESSMMSESSDNHHGMLD